MTAQPVSIEEIWRRYDDDEQRLSAPLSERMLDLAKLKPGMRVLDLATGRGEPAIRAAKRVAPTGSVLGVDIAESMLQMARERAVAENVSNLELLAMDAEQLESLLPSQFDASLARWCLMYFRNPVQSLRAARRAMVDGGIFVGAVWAEPERVSYYTFPRQVLAQLTDVPAIDFDVQGTFYYADIQRLHRDLVASGFRVLGTEDIDLPVMQAKTGEELVAWCRAFGLNRLLAPLSNAIQSQWETRVIAESEQYRNDEFIRLGGTTRIVVAVADGT